MDVISMEIADYLGKTIACDCGKNHTVEIGVVEISIDALEKVAGLIRKDGFDQPFLICDCNTYQVAGERLIKSLSEAGINLTVHVFNDTELVPDEQTLGEVMMNYEPGCDLIIGVGSGTISDLSRFFSHRMGVPYYIVATAPSMDGYASSVAPLIKNNLKTTFECHMPRAIIADLDVISKAPQNMIAAGFCDVVGKYTSLADWKLSAIINDEYYCDRVVAMTRHSLERTISLQDGISQGDPEAIGSLMEALVLAGISMSYVGNSRPASGSEHHLAHFWEMRLLFDHKAAVLHGTKVGMGTILITTLYQYLRDEGLDSISIARTNYPQVADWNANIERAFLDAAPEVIALEERAQKNGLQGWKQRINVISTRWQEVRAVLESVPSKNEIVRLVKGVGGVVDPGDVGITPELVQQAIMYAKEVRPRYTVLQLLWDLNLLNSYAQRLMPIEESAK
jgi:glycerol-1-phosphate dehydrogenase [NAD(P)+]